jgi:hypothetical protein
LLRGVVFKHHGFGGTVDEAVIREEERYINNRGRLSVEAAYDEMKVVQMRKELEDFWKGRGVTVEVSTNLTQVPSAPRYVILEINIYKK